MIDYLSLPSTHFRDGETLGYVLIMGSYILELKNLVG